MYSRYGDNSKRPVRLPEHYGGSAFSQQPTAPISVPKREPSRPIPREGVGEKASPVADRLLRAEAAEKEMIDLPPVPDISNLSDEPIEEKEEREQREEREAGEEKIPELPQKSSTASPFNFGALRRLFGGKEGEGGDDQDRLLLLGLILLLSRTEGDSDILLWLSLLLLCG